MAMLIALQSLNLFLRPPGTKTSFNQHTSILKQYHHTFTYSVHLTTPHMALANQYHLNTEPSVRKCLFLMTLTFLQTTLIMAFSTTNLALIYIMFEATLVPV